MFDLYQNLTAVLSVLRNDLPYVGMVDNLFEPLDSADGCHVRNRFVPAHTRQDSSNTAQAPNASGCGLKIVHHFERRQLSI